MIADVNWRSEQRPAKGSLFCIMKLLFRRTAECTIWPLSKLRLPSATSEYTMVISGQEWSDQMKKKLPRRELVAIVDKLLTQSLSPSERQQLFQRFEDGVPYPYPSELILHLQHEFKDSTALVDFALGQEKVPKLSRKELVTVARKLMTADIANEVESARLADMFTENVPHPDGTDLIFYPKKEFKSPEELVDYALAYKGPKANA